MFAGFHLRGDMRRTLFCTVLAASCLCCFGQAEKSVASFHVALLTPGPISDQSWNGGAYAGLLRIRDSLSAHISHVQTRTPAEFEENFREYGRQGYSLVIGHGFEFQDAAIRVAPAYPATVFAVTSSTISSPNVVGIRFAFEEPAYVAGMIAGWLTKREIIGGIGGTELPPVKAGFAAFAAGAHAVRPHVRMLTAYVGNWDDASAGKEQAHVMMAQGADVIFQNADAAGLGVFQAARETHAALVIGANANQNGIAPDVTIGSVVIDLPHAFLAVARAVRSGQLKGGTFDLGSASDAVRLTLNARVSNTIPPAARRAVDSVLTLLRAGTRPAGLP